LNEGENVKKRKSKRLFNANWHDYCGDREVREKQ